MTSTRKFLLHEERKAMLSYLEDQAIITRAQRNRVPGFATTACSSSSSPTASASR